jgi:multiple sugar transport system substrate-binding protein
MLNEEENMKKGLFICMWLVLTAGMLFAGASNDRSGGKTVIRGLYMKQAGYQMEDMEEFARRYEASHPNIDIQTEYVSFEALHDKIVTAGASGGTSYDFVLLDCIWPAEFAEAGFLLDVTDRITDKMKREMFSGALDAVYYNGKYWGLPFMGGNLWFYYNERMLNQAGFTEPPKTYSELQQMALAAKQKGVVEYPFIEGLAQQEVLTCAFTYILNAFGGQFFDNNNMPIFDSPQGVAALQYMVNNMKLGIYHPASLEAVDEDVRRIFSQGQAMFSINWMYQYALTNDPKESNIVGEARMSLMPGEVAKSATVNGGMGLAIMANSRHPDETWDYLLFLTDPELQIEFAHRGFPVWESAFADPRVAEKQPESYKLANEQFKYISNRPKVPFYTETSNILQKEVQAALLMKKTPQQALKDAKDAVLVIRSEFLK